MPDWKQSFSWENNCFQLGISLHFWMFVVWYCFSSSSLICPCVAPRGKKYSHNYAESGYSTTKMVFGCVRSAMWPRFSIVKLYIGRSVRTTEFCWFKWTKRVETHGRFLKYEIHKRNSLTLFPFHWRSAFWWHCGIFRKLYPVLWWCEFKSWLVVCIGHTQSVRKRMNNSKFKILN